MVGYVVDNKFIIENIHLMSDEYIIIYLFKKEINGILHFKSLSFERMSYKIKSKFNFIHFVEN